ncbi:MAG: phage portal protein [Clostridia bacterium]|nr:phage portal protein [Clostridia bacterium]
MMEFEGDYVLFVKGIENALQKKVLISPKMSEAMLLWEKLYKNRAPWLNEQVKSLNLAATIAGELACQATLDFNSKISGSRRADVIQEQVYDSVIFDIRRLVEYACATGGVVFKPYFDKSRLAVEYVRTNRFFPLGVDSRGEVVSAVFVERLQYKGRMYTRLEEHLLDGAGVTVQNHAFCGHGFWSLGRPVSMQEVPEWAELAERVILPGVQKPLFSYFKMPLANVVDMDSPLGVSVFAKSVDMIQEADKQFSRLMWEYEGGELAVDASVDALRMEGGDMQLPAHSKRLFRALDIDVGGSDLYSVYAPTLRDASYIDGLNEILIRVEDTCGLARGTVSNLNVKARTATELTLLRQRSYSTVTDIQKALQKALADLVSGLETMATVFDLLPKGNCQVTFEFDDSMAVDRKAQFEEMKQLVDQGILSKWEFRTWYFGETEEQAKEKLQITENTDV